MAHWRAELEQSKEEVEKHLAEARKHLALMLPLIPSSPVRGWSEKQKVRDAIGQLREISTKIAELERD